MTTTNSSPVGWDPPTIDDRAAAPRPKSPGGRTAWLVIGGVLVIATLGWGTYHAVGLLAHEEYTEIDTFAAAEVTSLDVSNGNGRVTVVGSASDEIVVTSDISEGLRAPRREMRVVDGRLDLEASCPVFSGTWCSVDFTVQIPRDVAVEIDADNGAIDVRGVDAAVDVRSDNGRVELVDIAGDVDAHSDNGRVVGRSLTSSVVNAQSDNGRVELQFDSDPTTVVAESDNGRVEVLLPETDVAYRLDISSDNGSVEQAVRVDPDSARSLTIKSDNGSVSVGYGD